MTTVVKSVTYTAPTKKKDGKTWHPGFDERGMFWYVYFYYQKWTSAFGEAGQVRYYYGCESTASLLPGPNDGRIDQDTLESSEFDWAVIFKIYKGEVLKIRLADYYTKYPSLFTINKGEHYSEYVTIKWSDIEKLIPFGKTFIIWGKGEQDSASLDLFYINTYYPISKTQTECATISTTSDEVLLPGTSLPPNKVARLYNNKVVYSASDTCKFTQVNESDTAGNNNGSGGAIVGSIEDPYWWSQINKSQTPPNLITSNDKYCAKETGTPGFGWTKNCKNNSGKEINNALNCFSSIKDEAFQNWCQADGYSELICSQNQEIWVTGASAKDLCITADQLATPLCKSLCNTDTPMSDCSEGIKNLCKDITFDNYESGTELQQEYCGCFLPDIEYEKFIKPATDKGLIVGYSPVSSGLCFYPKCTGGNTSKYGPNKNSYTCPNIQNCINNIDIGTNAGTVNIKATNECSQSTVPPPPEPPSGDDDPPAAQSLWKKYMGLWIFLIVLVIIGLLVLLFSFIKK